MSNRMPTKEDAELMQAGRDVQDMLNSPGWKAYRKVLQFHYEAKIAEALAITSQLETNPMARVLSRESANGAVLGLKLALELPQVIIKSGEETRAELA